MTMRSNVILTISVFLTAVLSFCVPQSVCADNIDVPSVTATIFLETGKTESVSLKKFINGNDDARSSCNFIVKDTLAVRFSCTSYSFYVGLPAVSPPEEPNIGVCVNSVKNANSKRYGSLSWSAERQSNGSYTVSGNADKNVLVLFPGSYTLVYDYFFIVEFPDGISSLNDSIDTQRRASVMNGTHSTIDISMECYKPDPEMIVPIMPDPETVSSGYGTGMIFGEADVSDNGAATYGFPIEMPKHTFTPQIGISYNSQMSDYGPVGYGINISGISSITRTGKNKFYDNDYKGVGYTDDDNYLLDGKRLIPDAPMSRSYTVEGSPLTTVTRNGSGAQTWFKVVDNGVVYEYGRSLGSANAFTVGNGSECIVEWHVNRATDANGNYTIYRYVKNDNFIYPSQILYGFNESMPNLEYSNVLFEYEDLGVNKRSFVVGNQRGYISRRLKSVTTGSGASIYRKYLFSYDTASDKSIVGFARLKSVMVQSDGSSLSPIVFDWNPLSDNLKCLSLTGEIENANPDMKESGFQYLSADLNADGVSDIIKISTVSNHTYIYISLSEKDQNGNVSFRDPIIREMPSRLSPNPEEVSYVSCELQSVMDVNGDGYNDLIFVDNNGDTALYWIVYGYGIQKDLFDIEEFAVELKASREQSLNVVFDADGDGKDEVVYLDTNLYNGSYYGGMIDKNLTGSLLPDIFQFKLPSKPKDIFSGDYDNDGLSDLIFFYSGGYTIYFNNGGLDHTRLFTESNKYVSTAIGNKYRMTQGDFNGDGLIDFVYFEKKSKKLAVAQNNGDGTFTVDYSVVIGPDMSETSPNQRLTVCDFDHDGYMDVMVAWTHSNKIKTQWFYSDGSTLLLKDQYATVNTDDDIKPANSIFVGDFNGDGVEEVANLGARLNADDTGYSFRKINLYTSGKAYEGGRLSSVSDGTGRKMSFWYSSLSDNRVYSMQPSKYPVKSNFLPMSVVSSFFQSNAERTGIETKYRYETLRSHLTGRGSLGFSKVVKENRVTGTKQSVEIAELDKKWCLPTKMITKTFVGTDSTVTVVSNRVEDRGNNYLSLPELIEETDFDGNKTCTEYTYFDTGLPQTKKTISLGVWAMYKAVKYEDYRNIGNKWLPNSVTAIQKHTNEADEYIDRTEFQYDGSGNVLVKTEHANTEMALQTTCTYDRRGNVLSTVQSGVGVVPVTKHFEYDSDSRFLVRTYSSPASAEIRYTYDIWGNMLTETDETDPDNRLVRTMKYDAWGKKTAETAPDGTTTTYKYGWGDSDEYKTFLTESKDGCAARTRWFDSLGRERLTKSIGQEGIKTATATYYNDKGEIEKVESFSGKLILTKTYAYDRRGRIVSENEAGRVSTYSYGNRKVTRTTNGRVYENHTDPWGNVVLSVDPQSSIEYYYGSNGKPMEVTSGDAVLTIIYDSAGNRILLDDPDAGFNNYAYAADGTVLSNMDGRGVETAYTFDNLGRTEVTRVGDEIVFDTYGTEGYGLQRLTRKADGCNQIDYTYDRYGRVIKESRTVYGEGVFEYEFEYNSYGQLAKTIYPGGLEVCYGYDLYGNRQTITVNGETLWSFKSSDGRKTTVSLLGDFEHVSEVDRNGYIEGMSLSRTVDGVEKMLRNLILQHDVSTGNTVSRAISTGKKRLPGGGVHPVDPDLPVFPFTDTRLNVKDGEVSIIGPVEIDEMEVRTYGYDEMDRLVSVSVDGDKVLSMSYDSSGNILHKSDVGDYSYNTGRLHAVSEISNPRNEVPSAVQNVEFNDWGKVAYVSEDGSVMAFDYGPDGERWHSELADSTGFVRGTVYFGNYEQVREPGPVSGSYCLRDFYYLGENILVIRQDGVFKPYILFTDEQGSVLAVYDRDGNEVFSATYDEWGCQEVEKNEIGLRRGYTGHEMMPEFGIINMNGRLFDPVLARFFSPDNYVQQPDNSQNFNRYTYCLNNPLKYTDPSGQWFGIDDLIVAGVSFVTGYLSSGIQTGNWGWKSVKAGICSGLSSYIGFNSIGAISGKAALGKYLRQMCFSAVINNVMPPVALPVTSNFSLSMSPMLAWGESGLSAGMDLGLNFSFGDGWNVSVSGGVSNQYYGGNMSASYKGWGAGYGLTHYYEQSFNGVDFKAQNVGTITAKLDNFSIRLSNDLFAGGGHDQYRTHAIELSYKNWSIGNYVTTNNGAEESGYTKDMKNKEKPPVWPKGEAYSAPLWIGYKSGNQIYRFGYSHPQIQDKTQNAVHSLIKSPHFKNYDKFKTGAYVYSGYNSPYSLW